ncbi:MAG: DUF2254 domain-containing protein, partial [Pseudohongiellaceae bacterium]
MKTRLLNLWESVSTSFWFIPTLMVSAAIVLSLVMVNLDQRDVIQPEDVFGVLYQGGSEGSRYILSTIAGSMITIAGVVFSITIVALTLASSQYGPHLLRNFIKDKGNQVVLGTFIATFIYCLFTLRAVRDNDGVQFVPELSVTVALGLAVVNVGVLIYFIHHVSVSLGADTVIARVHGDLLAYLSKFFPEHDSEKETVSDERPPGNVEGNTQVPDMHSYPCRFRLAAPCDGYVQAVDYGGIMEIATSEDLLVNCTTRPGKLVVTGGSLAEVYCRQLPTGDVRAALIRTHIIGSVRTPEQDAEFSFNQLVEIALRALSPGINDPNTAMACIDWLGAALCFLCGRRLHASIVYDDDDVPRLIR